MRKLCLVIVAAGLMPVLATAQLKELKPAWNLFSSQQDVQIGREAAQEIERKVPLVHNRDVDGYLNTILGKLERSQYAHTLNRDGSRGELFPFTIHAVHDKNLNAFSLPGGPIFVNTGLILAADNEAQLAGVIGHEMSHVVLRHSTSQASKQNLVALPVLLASALIGNRSLLAELGQIGLAFTANSALLKFTRADEEQADYNGAEIAAEAGYNPLELANFFEKLESKRGHEGTLTQFLSDHPNPGNRVAAVHEELRQLPHKLYVDEQTGQFQRIKNVVAHLPAPKQPRAELEDEGPIGTPSSARPSGEMASYHGRTFSLDYPQNWRAYGDQHADAVTIAPREGLVRGANGQVAVGYGLEANYYLPQGAVDLDRDTQALIRRLRESNSGIRLGREGRSIEVAGQAALLTTLNSRSPYRGEEEVDVLLTVVRPEGLFYIIFIAPQSEFDHMQGTFEEIVRSVKF